MTDESPPGKVPPPWLFGITNLPFGVGGNFASVAMPFLLRRAELDVTTISAIGALALVPATYQLFWAPILDLGIRRRSWLVLVSFLGGLCLAISLLLKLPEQLTAFKVFMVLGEVGTGLVASCNGALVSTTLPPELRGRAAGWVNAANLGSAVLGGGLVISLATHVSLYAAALAVFLLSFLPSLVALTVPEPPPTKEPALRHLRKVAVDIWRAVKSRRGWTGLLFCCSPVGTAALLQLFSALGPDFGASPAVVEALNGYVGGFVTALGALLSGYLLDRMAPRPMYLLGGVLLAVCGAFMALLPATQGTLIVGTVAYLLVAGLAYTAFSAVVFEIVGDAGASAASLYSIFPAVANGAIMYVMLLDGRAYERWKTAGLLWTDAALNLAGVLFLVVLLRFVLPEKPGDGTPG